MISSEKINFTSRSLIQVHSFTMNSCHQIKWSDIIFVYPNTRSNSKICPLLNNLNNFRILFAAKREKKNTLSAMLCGSVACPRLALTLGRIAGGCGIEGIGWPWKPCKDWILSLLNCISRKQLVKSLTIWPNSFIFRPQDYVFVFITLNGRISLHIKPLSLGQSAIPIF